MGGFFGTISTRPCVNDLFYGTDYNSHLGTKRAGMVTFDKEKGFNRSIHSLERDYFRSRFEDELDSFKGNQGIGCHILCYQVDCGLSEDQEYR